MGLERTFFKDRLYLIRVPFTNGDEVNIRSTSGTTVKLARVYIERLSG